MKPLQASSGDLNADRRADYAEMLHASGEHGAAAELLLGALELAPRWAAGWFRLGEMQEAAGAPDLAAQAWTMSMRLDPADRFGAALKLHLIGRGTAGDAPPPAFVETLFDQYADTFDDALVGKLGYRVPEVLDQAIRAARPGRFRLAFDLGCGTGLMGQRLRPIVDRLEGMDISARMLAKARAKGIYDNLARADLGHFSHAGPEADLIVAADVFIYVGRLETVIARIAAALAVDGLFAFSIEALATAGDAGFALRPTRRYAHALGYVRGVLEANGLAVLSADTMTIRMDRGEPVDGFAIVSRKVG